MNTEWNPKGMKTLDAWRGNLSLALAANLPSDATVELIAQDNKRQNCVDRYIAVHLADKTVQIKLHFPESLDAVVIRVLEAIK